MANVSESVVKRDVKRLLASESEPSKLTWFVKFYDERKAMMVSYGMGMKRHQSW